MLLLTSASDLVQVITGSAGAIAAHSSWIDNASGTITPGRTNTASITGATTTTVVGSPASSTQRNVKLLSLFNTSTTVANKLTVQHTDGTNAEALWVGTLQPGESVVFDQNGDWNYYDATGALKPSSAITNPNNCSTASQAPTAGTDTILTGSTLTIPASKLRIGTKVRWKFSVAKTGAGTVASTFTVRCGMNGGTTGDTSIASLSTGTATAAADAGEFTIEMICRGPLSGSGVFQSHLSLTHNLATTGLSTTGVGVQATSAAFDVTQAGLTLSVSFNGGTSAVWTFQMVSVESLNL